MCTGGSKEQEQPKSIERAARDKVHVVVARATEMSRAGILAIQVVLLHEMNSVAGDALEKEKKFDQ